MYTFETCDILYILYVSIAQNFQIDFIFLSMDFITNNLILKVKMLSQVTRSLCLKKNSFPCLAMCDILNFSQNILPIQFKTKFTSTDYKIQILI